MKLEKLAVCFVATAAMSAFTPAFAQTYSSDSGVGMRNTDANAPSVTNFTGGSEMAWPTPIEPNSVTTLPDSTASSEGANGISAQD